MRAALATRLDVPLELSAVGTVEAANAVDVKSRIGGQITAVRFNDGDDVKAGQVLFVIAPDMLQREIAEQKAQIERDIASAQGARDVVARDSANQQQALSEANIASELSRDGILSRQRTDQLTASSAAALATLHADQASAASASAGVVADRARLAQTQLQLAYTQVTAPIAGRTGAALLKAGNVVRENDTTLVQVLQISTVRVTFGVPESALPEVQQRQAGSPLIVQATLPSGETSSGVLSFVDNTVNTTTGTVEMKATFDNSARRLWPGEFLNVRLRLHIDAAQIAVPTIAVQAAQDGTYVWAVAGGIARMQPVRIARRYSPPQGGEWSIVSGGLASGTEVVTEGQLRLTAGSHVQLLSPAVSL